MMTYALEAAGVPVIHRSMPDAHIWWSDTDPQTGEPFEPHRTVIVQRRPDVTSLAILARKPPMAADIREARANWRRAITVLATFVDAVWVSYEAFIVDPHAQMRRLAIALGFDLPDDWALDVRDENAKWLSVLEP